MSLGLVATVTSFLSFSVALFALCHSVKASRFSSYEIGKAHMSDSLRDLKSVVERAPILKRHWKSAAAMQGASNGSRLGLKSAECDDWLAKAERLQLLLDAAAVDFEDLRGRRLSKRVSRLYDYKTTANALKEEMQLSWDHCLFEQERSGG